MGKEHRRGNGLLRHMIGRAFSSSPRVTGLTYADLRL